MMKRANRVLLLSVVIPLVGGVILGGCGPVIGWTVNVFRPPKKVEALYRPPEGKKILVFVDDLWGPVGYEQIKGKLTERLNEQLMEHGVAQRTVPYRLILRLKAATPEFDGLAVSQVGQRLGADLVLYVHIDRFSLKDNEVSPLWHGRMEVTVRMVDVETGRLWPKDRQAGYAVKPIENPTESHPSSTYEIDLAESLAKQTADRIARLLYDHKISAEEAAKQEQES